MNDHPSADSLLTEAAKFIEGFAASGESGFARQRKALDWMMRYRNYCMLPTPQSCELPSGHDVWVRAGNVKTQDVRTVMEAIRDLMPLRPATPPHNEALAAASRIANEIELHGEQDPFTADLRILVAAVRAAQPPTCAHPFARLGIDADGVMWCAECLEKPLVIPVPFGDAQTKEPAQ